MKHIVIIRVDINNKDSSDDDRHIRAVGAGTPGQEAAGSGRAAVGSGGGRTWLGCRALLLAGVGRLGREKCQGEQQAWKCGQHLWVSHSGPGTSLCESLPPPAPSSSSPLSLSR